MKSSIIRIFLLTWMLCFGFLSYAQKEQHNLSHDLNNYFNTVQNGFVYFYRTISHPLVQSQEDTIKHVYMYFYRLENKECDYVLDEGSTIYLRKSGKEMAFRAVMGGYQRIDNFISPMQTFGLSSILMNEEYRSQDIYFRKFTPDYSSINFLNYSNITGSTAKSQVGFNASLVPTYFKKELFAGLESSSTEEVLKKHIFNTFTYETFHDVYEGYLSKVLKPIEFSESDNIYIGNSLPLFDIEGNQYRSPENKLQLFISVPSNQNIKPELFRDIMKLKTLNEDRLATVWVTSGELYQQVVDPFNGNLNMYLCDERFLKEYHLYDSEVRFLLVNRKGMILREFVGYYPEQMIRLNSSIDRWDTEEE